MGQDPLEEKFLTAIQRLWPPGVPLVVAVSGGSDSMALLTLLMATLAQWPSFIHPIHINHGLREQSTADANWVVSYVGQNWGLSVTVKEVDATPKTSHESIEMAARRARYQALHQYAEEFGRNTRIVVAHQSDDQAETILMHILVGTGIEGLSGMKPVHGQVMRPLLEFSREELRQYLRANRISWREDETNSDVKWVRSRIRHRVMPFLTQEVNPKLSYALIRLGQQASELSKWIDNVVNQFASEHHIDLSHPAVSIPVTGLPRPVIAAMLSRYGIAQGLRLSAQQINAALAGDTTWPKGFRVIHGEGALHLMAPKPMEPVFPDCVPVELPERGRFPWQGGYLEIDTETWPFGEQERYTAAIDRAKWPRLAIRCWQPGDSIRPLGMHGTKKLQDVFSDCKISRHLRHRWPLVIGSTEGKFRVLSVVGLVIDEEAKASPGALVHGISWHPDIEDE
ncbi:MAG: tRNA lysidine(34) synthetase TilS [Firmicutes bacterium]|nr:tRNA lysidine(34) synthetase TilS [Bacillota bacterium]